MSQQKQIITVKGIKPHIGQKYLITELNKIEQQIKDSGDKKTHYFIYNCSRQFGKSLLLENLLLKYSLENSNSKTMWVSPTNAQSRKVFRDIIGAIYNSGLIKDKNESELRIVFINGTEVLFKSAEQGDHLRGYSVHYLFIDEFSFIKESLWPEVLQKFLTVTGRRVFISSTPRGKNLFYNLYQYGQSNEYPNYHSYTVNYLMNPLADIEEIEKTRQLYPENVFRAEYLAEFITEGGDLFNNLYNYQTIHEWQEPIPGVKYYAGIDLAKQDDYTVLTILNSLKEVVFIYRDRHKDWMELANNLLIYLNRYKPKTIIEVNSIGDVIFDILKKQYRDIDPFYTGINKQNLIERLIFEINSGNIHLPTKLLFPDLINELETFSYEYSPKSRTIRYGARKGFHDDTVMSLAFAIEALYKLKSAGNYNVGVHKPSPHQL